VLLYQAFQVLLIVQADVWDVLMQIQTVLQYVINLLEHPAPSGRTFQLIIVFVPYSVPGTES
jgi:hypothetical protein